VTHRGPCQPLPCWDSVTVPGAPASPTLRLREMRRLRKRVTEHRSVESAFPSPAPDPGFVFASGTGQAAGAGGRFCPAAAQGPAAPAVGTQRSAAAGKSGGENPRHAGCGPWSRPCLRFPVRAAFSLSHSLAFPPGVIPSAHEKQALKGLGGAGGYGQPRSLMWVRRWAVSPVPQPWWVPATSVPPCTTGSSPPAQP